MNRFRRFLKLAWVAQLALVVLAAPAAHVHRHGAGGCSSAVCSSACETACSAGHSHDHGDGCSHDHGAPRSRNIARLAGESTVQAPTDGSGIDHRCAACELQRLIGQGFSPADTLLLQEQPTLSAPRLVSTCCGRDVEVRGCRGPPLAC